LVTAGPYAPSASDSASRNSVQGARRGNAAEIGDAGPAPSGSGSQRSAPECRASAIRGSDPAVVDVKARGLEPSAGAVLECASQRGPLNDLALGDTIPAHLTAQAVFIDGPGHDAGPHEHIAAEPPNEYVPRSGSSVRLANPGG
jgi:hypothetical protein